MIEQNKPPFFSIVIPVYNKEPHIARSINSVLNQTFTDFELIIVCDPSTDNSNAEVAKFSDPRIRVFHRDEPGPGGYAARNLGTQEARADWIAFLDADDEWYKDHLENYNNLTLKNPTISFFSSAYQVKENTDKFEYDSYSKSLHNKSTHTISLEKYLELVSIGYRPIWTSVVCMKRKTFKYELFPDGIAERGGDQTAWVYYLAHEKKLIWSNHIGAIYHKNSVNMVTKSAASSPHIHKYEYKIVKGLINSKEKKYFIRYLNKKISNSFFNNKISKGIEIFNLENELHFKKNPAFYLVMIALSKIPVSYFLKLKSIREKLNAKFK